MILTLEFPKLRPITNFITVPAIVFSPVMTSLSEPNLLWLPVLLFSASQSLMLKASQYEENQSLRNHSNIAGTVV
jgi:hypothetical protein